MKPVTGHIHASFWARHILVGRGLEICKYCMDQSECSRERNSEAHKKFIGM
ncbi:MAG: hypothetical protein ACM3SR_02885 [Ignavibacteriales bacterium]